MTGSPRKRNQGIKKEDAIGFLRESALVTVTGGEPSLTSRGERFLSDFKESSKGRSPDSSLEPVSLDALDRTEGTSQS
jgi:hypothetical protein